MNTYSEIDASPKTRARTGVAALASLSLALFAGAKAYSHSSAASSVVTAFDVLVESNATRACAACADLSVMDCVIALGAQAKAKGQQALVTSDPSFSSDSTFVNELTSLCAEGTISLSTDEASTLISDFYTTEVADGASTLAQFDTDSSGGISMDEWIAAYSDLESAMPAQVRPDFMVLSTHSSSRTRDGIHPHDHAHVCCLFVRSVLSPRAGYDGGVHERERPGRRRGDLTRRGDRSWRVGVGGRHPRAGRGTDENANGV